MAFSISNMKGVKKEEGSRLNVSTNDVKIDARRSEYIKFSLLEPSPLNETISKDEIEELASQIYNVGQLQPFVVLKKENGKYEVLGGGRRYLAIQHLIETGKFEENLKVECKNVGLESIDLPITEEEKKRLIWLSTNQYRNKTDKDKYIEALEWKKIIQSLRKNGIEMLATGMEQDGTPMERPIKGVRTRQLIAEQTGMSPSQVGKIEEIDINGTEELKDAIKKDKIGLHSASKISKLPEEEQKEFLQQMEEEKEEEETITSKDIAEFQKRKQAGKENVVESDEKEFQEEEQGKQQDEPNVLITEENVSEDIHKVESTVKSGKRIYLTQNEYREYQRHIDALVRLLSKD
jgi:ParB family chromosome partitioning protein